MDLGTLGKQMRFGTVREEIGMRDDCDRREDAKAAEAKGHDLK